MFVFGLSLILLFIAYDLLKLHQLNFYSYTASEQKCLSATTTRRRGRRLRRWDNEVRRCATAREIVALQDRER